MSILDKEIKQENKQNNESRINQKNQFGKYQDYKIEELLQCFPYQIYKQYVRVFDLQY